jgi:AraC family transcriptional regulator, regulatory protein of adaptative response / methylated-DNA-[protein]-cysteine methyltransferase
MKMQSKYSKKHTTSFQDKVYKEVRRIRAGEVRTYKEIAQAIGHPKAFRAVGTALNKNSNLAEIPCHRVVRSDGTIGGYRKGAKKKRALLQKEGALKDIRITK